MPRPRLRRRLQGRPHVTYYKPQGVPLRQLETEALSHEAWEALRLRYIEGYDQTETAKRMHTSQSSVQRILTEANRALARALIEGKAIRINTET
jgi:predicted DNA-binding protein (UPF0251 family)